MLLKRNGENLVIGGCTLASDRAEVDNYPNNEIWQEKRIEIWIRDESVFKEILSYNPTKILSGYEEVIIHFPILLSQDFNLFYISEIKIENKDDCLKLGFRFLFDVAKWDKPWSIAEHGIDFLAALRDKKTRFELLKVNLSQASDKHLEVWTNGGDDFWRFAWMLVKVNKDESPLINQFTQIFSIFQSTHDESLSHLEKEKYPEALVERFRFPSEIKTVCKQYLLYFTEFLREVGLETSLSLGEESEDVLFIVEPRNKGDALEKLKTALEVYLRLPNSPELYSSNLTHAKISVQKLSSQIQFLHSQLTLANATVEQQNLIIQQQNILLSHHNNFIQSQQFSTQVLLESASRNSLDEIDKEPLIKNYLMLKDYDFGPFNIGLAELLRKLKEYFSK